MLTFLENCILQKSAGAKKNWSVQELLEIYEPLSGEPLAIRNGAMKRLLPMAEDVYSELSETAILRYHFWKQLQPQRINVQQFEYSIKISQTYHWELSVTPEGLFYKDISPLYGQMPGMVHEQLFSDFWFYGPMMPLPDLGIRQQVVANIRNAFLQIGPVSQKHFQLFEYPVFANTPQWEDGDHKCQDYIIMRSFGIEYGRTNWHDGLVYAGFISFERFLADPVALERLISPKLRKEIQELLKVKEPPMREEPDPKKAEWKQMYMENGGMHHYIFRDYGDAYKPSPVDEFIWNRELLDELTQRLKTIDHYSGFQYIANVLRYHSVPNVEEILVETAKGPNLKARQAIAQVLGEDLKSEKVVDVLLSLLEFGHKESYWQDYVFSSFGRLRQNKGVQQFIIQCLQGDDEMLFKKAVDVLSLWGIKGDQALTDRQLLLSLNWPDACANDPELRQSLEKVIKIIVQI